MIIKRKTPLPIKSYHVQGRTDKEKDYNIHLYNTLKRGVREYTFVISEDSQKEDSVVDNENIISILSLNDQEETKKTIQKIGDAVKKLRQLDTNYNSQEFISEVKESLKDIKTESFWVSQALTRSMKPKYGKTSSNTNKNKNSKSENKSYGGNQKTIYQEGDEKLKATKPIIMIETLVRAGFLDLIEIEPNGDESKYKVEFTNKNEHGDKSFLISVAQHSGLEGNKSELFNDFYNSITKGLGNGGLGILTHLGENGLFSNEIDPNEDRDVKINRAKAFFETELSNIVNDDELVFTESSKTRVFLSKTISFQPVKKFNKKTMTTMTDFFAFRGIPKETIDRCVREDKIFTGDYYVSRILKEKKSNGKGFQENYAYRNQPYIRLQKPFTHEFYDAERFQIERTKDEVKPFIYDKKNTGTLNGKFFCFGKEEQPEMAILHEAALDALSSHTLLKYANVNADEIKYMSTQGASHMKKFFGNNAGFYTDVSKDLKPDKNGNFVRTFAVKKTTYKKEIADEIKDFYIESLKDKKIVFCDYGDTTEEIKTKLDMMNEIFGNRISVESFNFSKDVNFYQQDKNTCLLLDRRNFNEFLDKMALNFEKNTETNSFEMKTFFEMQTEEKLTPESIKEIRENIIKLFGTENIAFALDNDHAGLKYLVTFTEMKRHFGINTSYMIPNDLSYENFQGIELKPMIKEYESLCNDGKYEEAYSKLIKYIEQKPTVDCNDVLKTYQKLEKTNPQEAQKILDYKLEQLGITQNHPLMLKKKQTSSIKNRL